MALEQLKVREIVKQAVGKAVDIPEFQREFVWDPEQVKLFAESLYRDYPVGSFLLWDSSGYHEAKTAQGTEASLWVVDGQQRTTALCLLLGMKPFWWPKASDWNRELQQNDVMVNVVPVGSDGRLEFALPNPVRRRDPRWISLRDVLGVERVEDLTQLAQDVVQRIGDSGGEAMRLFGKVHAHLQSIWQIRERDIPVLKVNHEVEDVAEIFARLNQAGTRVKEADVILALAAVRNPGWVREEYLPFRDYLEEHGWDLEAGIFIRTMTGIGHGRARLIEVPKEFWNPSNLPKVWKRSRDAITDVVKRLAEFGILAPDLLPSTNSLIPLVVLHKKWQESAGYRFGRALRWFLLANKDGRYSGSAITSLNEDVRAIVDAQDLDAALERIQQRLRVAPTVSQEDFLNRYDRAGSRFLRLVLYLVLFHRNAPDWIDETRIGYDKTGQSITSGFEPQWHHIYPRRVLKKAGIGPDEVHTLANITVLNERTNVNKLSGKEPSRYIREYHITVEGLRAHLIPEPFVGSVSDGKRIRDQWSVENFLDFLTARAQLLADETNAFIARLENS